MVIRFYTIRKLEGLDESPSRNFHQLALQPMRIPAFSTGNKSARSPASLTSIHHQPHQPPPSNPCRMAYFTNPMVLLQPVFSSRFAR